MKYELKVYSIWEFGQRKDAEGNPHQEDSIYPAFGKEQSSDRTFILCDGMGGHDAGEVASATVCEAMAQSIRNDGHDAEGVFTDDDFQRALSAAFDALDRKDSGTSEKKMGTTMTFLKLHQQGATIAHMGDSRVYHFRPGKTEEETLILHQTEDHSLVNDLIKVGELTKEEARHSKQKNVITRAMQPHLAYRPKADLYHTSDIQAGDYFYLCSDGMLEQDEMEDGTVLKRIFSGQVDSDEQRICILRGATDHNKDNHSALVIHVLKVMEVDTVTPESKAEAVSTELPKHMAVVEDDAEENAHFPWLRYLLIFLLLLIILGALQWWKVYRKEHVVTPTKVEQRNSVHRKHRAPSAVKRVAPARSTSDEAVVNSDHEATQPVMPEEKESE